MKGVNSQVAPFIFPLLVLSNNPIVEAAKGEAGDALNLSSDSTEPRAFIRTEMLISFVRRLCLLGRWELSRDFP